jgi:hypothetical protein
MSNLLLVLGILLDSSWESAQLLLESVVRERSPDKVWLKLDLVDDKT